MEIFLCFNSLHSSRTGGTSDSHAKLSKVHTFMSEASSLSDLTDNYAEKTLPKS